MRADLHVVGEIRGRGTGAGWAARWLGDAVKVAWAERGLGTTILGFSSLSCSSSFMKAEKHGFDLQSSGSWADWMLRP